MIFKVWLNLVHSIQNQGYTFEAATKIAFRILHSEKVEPMRRKPNILDTIDDETIIDALPHGSGIDASWNISRYDNGNVLAECSYHGMNQGGYYDGWQDFNIRLFPVIPPNSCNGNYQPDVIDFKLSLSGYRQQKNWTYGLRDYLEELIGYCLSEANILKGRTDDIQTS